VPFCFYRGHHTEQSFFLRGAASALKTNLFSGLRCNSFTACLPVPLPFATAARAFPLLRIIHGIEQLHLEAAKQ
jgi:hypothetical protein